MGLKYLFLILLLIFNVKVHGDSGYPILLFPSAAEMDGRLIQDTYAVALDNVCLSSSGLSYETLKPVRVCIKAMTKTYLCRMGEGEDCIEVKNNKAIARGSLFVQEKIQCTEWQKRTLSVRRIDQFGVYCSEYRLKSQGEVFELECLKQEHRRFPGPVKFTFYALKSAPGELDQSGAQLETRLLATCPSH